MRRATVALPSLSCLALRPPVAPTGVGQNKRQKLGASALSRVRSYLRQLSEIVQGLENSDDWLTRFREAAFNLFMERYPNWPGQRYSARKWYEPRKWLSWGDDGFEVAPVPKSDAEEGEVEERWEPTYALLLELEGRIDQMRRDRGLPGLRDKPKNKKQKTATPAQQQRVNQTQQQRGGTRESDREDGDGYFNAPAGRQGGPKFVEPELLVGRDKVVLKEELKKKWPDGLKERLVARRDPDGRCCAARPDQ